MKPGIFVNYKHIYKKNIGFESIVNVCLSLIYIDFIIRKAYYERYFNNLYERIFATVCTV